MGWNNFLCVFALSLFILVPPSFANEDYKRCMENCRQQYLDCVNTSWKKFKEQEALCERMLQTGKQLVFENCLQQAIDEHLQEEHVCDSEWKQCLQKCVDTYTEPFNVFDYIYGPLTQAEPCNFELPYGIKGGVFEMEQEGWTTGSMYYYCDTIPGINFGLWKGEISLGGGYQFSGDPDNPSEMNREIELMCRFESLGGFCIFVPIDKVFGGLID